MPPSVTLLEPPAAGPKGSVYLRYGLTDGAPGTGDMSAGQGLTVIDDRLAVVDLVALIPEQGKHWWAILVSNQWPLPGEGTRHVRESPGIPGFSLVKYRFGLTATAHQ